MLIDGQMMDFILGWFHIYAGSWYIQLWNCVLFAYSPFAEKVLTITIYRL